MTFKKNNFFFFISVLVSAVVQVPVLSSDDVQEKVEYHVLDDALERRSDFSKALQYVVTKHPYIFSQIKPRDRFERLVRAYARAWLNKTDYYRLEDKLYEYAEKYLVNYDYLSPGLVALFLLNFLELDKDYCITSFTHHDNIFYMQGDNYYVIKNGKNYAIKKNTFLIKSLEAEGLILKEIVPYIILGDLFKQVIYPFLTACALILIYLLGNPDTSKIKMPFIKYLKNDSYVVIENGLPNFQYGLNNVCYFNSLMQGVAHHDIHSINSAYQKLRQKNQQEERDVQNSLLGPELARQMLQAKRNQEYFLRDLYALLNSVKARYVPVGQIKKVAESYRQISNGSLVFDNSQQDPHEWLQAASSILLEVLGEKYQGKIQLATGKQNPNFPWQDETTFNELERELTTKKKNDNDSILWLDFGENVTPNTPVSIKKLIEKNYNITKDRIKEEKATEQVTLDYDLIDYLTSKGNGNHLVCIDGRLMTKTQVLQELNDYLFAWNLKDKYDTMDKDELPQTYKDYTLNQWLDKNLTKKDYMKIGTDGRSQTWSRYEKIKDAIRKHNKKAVGISILDNSTIESFKTAGHSLAKFDKETTIDTTTTITNKLRWILQQDKETILGRTALLLGHLIPINDNNTLQTIIQNRGLKPSYNYSPIGQAFPCLRYTCDMYTTVRGEMPKKLTIGIKRYQQNNQGHSHKIQNPIIEFVNLKIKGQQYRLNGGVRHTGTRTGGHYTAIVKTSNDQYEVCNDSSITPFTEDLAEGLKNAYILFYDAVDSNTQQEEAN